MTLVNKEQKTLYKACSLDNKFFYDILKFWNCGALEMLWNGIKL